MHLTAPRLHPRIQRGTQSSSHSADLIHSANTPHRLYIQGPHHCSYVSLNFPERQTVPSKSLSKTKAWPCFWSLQSDTGLTSLHCLQTFPQPGRSVSTKFRLREREKKIPPWLWYLHAVQMVARTDVFERRKGLLPLRSPVTTNIISVPCHLSSLCQKLSFSRIEKVSFPSDLYVHLCLRSVL